MVNALRFTKCIGFDVLSETNLSISRLVVDPDQRDFFPKSPFDMGYNDLPLLSL